MSVKKNEWQFKVNKNEWKLTRMNENWKLKKLKEINKEWKSMKINKIKIPPVLGVHAQWWQEYWSLTGTAAKRRDTETNWWKLSILFLPVYILTMHRYGYFLQMIYIL